MTKRQFLLREAIAIVTVGLLLAVLMVDAVVGASSGFAPAPGLLPSQLAEGGQ
jgi:hypothetical protein